MWVPSVCAKGGTAHAYACGEGGGGAAEEGIDHAGQDSGWLLGLPGMRDTGALVCAHWAEEDNGGRGVDRGTFWRV